MANAITILWSNGEMDPQAARAANTLVDFRTIITKRKEQFALRLRPLHYQNENPPQFPNFSHQVHVDAMPLLIQERYCWTSMPLLPRGNVKSSSRNIPGFDTAPANAYNPNMFAPALNQEDAALVS